MITREEVDESLETQIKRHETLKEIIALLETLQKSDDEGADWVLEKLAEG